jgi:hypothetical protein
MVRRQALRETGQGKRLIDGWIIPQDGIDFFLQGLNPVGRDSILAQDHSANKPTTASETVMAIIVKAICRALLIAASIGSWLDSIRRTVFSRKTIHRPRVRVRKQRGKGEFS